MWSLGTQEASDWTQDTQQLGAACCLARPYRRPCHLVLTLRCFQTGNLVLSPPLSSGPQSLHSLGADLAELGPGGSVCWPRAQRSSAAKDFCLRSVPHVYTHRLAHHTYDCSVRGGVWNPARPSSLQDPIPMAGGQAGSFLVSDLRAKTGKKRQKSSSLQEVVLPGTSGRPLPCLAAHACDVGSPPHLAAVGPLTAVLARGPFCAHSACPTSAASRCGPSSFVSACSLGHGPCENALAPAHGPAQSLRFERQLKKDEDGLILWLEFEPNV